MRSCVRQTTAKLKNNVWSISRTVRDVLDMKMVARFKCKYDYEKLDNSFGYADKLGM